MPSLLLADFLGFHVADLIPQLSHVQGSEESDPVGDGFPFRILKVVAAKTGTVGGVGSVMAAPGANTPVLVEPDTKA